MGLPRRWALLGGALAIAATIWVSIYFQHKLTSVGERLDIWQAALSGLSIAGRGIGSFTADHPGWEYVHSDLLQYAYELGVGAILLAAFAAYAAWRSPPGPLRAVAVTLGAEAAIAFPFHVPLAVLLAGVVAGFMARRGPRLRMEQPVGGGSPSFAV
jgi:hypothetical protein